MSYFGGGSFAGFGGNDYGHGIALDTAGDAYITGVTGSSRFPTTSGINQTQQPRGAGAGSGSVTKLPLGPAAPQTTTALTSSPLDRGPERHLPGDRDRRRRFHRHAHRLAVQVRVAAIRAGFLRISAPSGRAAVRRT